MDFVNSLLVETDKTWVYSEKPGLIIDFGEVGWFSLAVWVVVVVFFAQLLYTFKVIFTLAIVEASPAISLPLNTNARKAADVLGINSRPQYVTGSICGALKHLRTQAGALSAWRGLGASIGYAFAVLSAKSSLVGFLETFLPGFITRPVASILSALILARFSLTITHIIISRPQPTWWITRVLSMPWSSARQTLPAIAHCMLAQSVVHELFVFAKFDGFDVVSRVVLVLLGFALTAFVVIPMWVGLVRVQASLLPETEEAIIRFDRGFGKEEGGALSFKEAMRSVKCSEWRRLGGLVGRMMGSVMILAVVAGLARFALIKSMINRTNA